jgi:hypothetical protein
MFDYTQRKFWGGPWYGYTSLTVISILGGFFGLDHLWLRSPLSGFLKFMVNIFTLGLWYFYDLLQIFGEQDSVMKNGLGAPFVGPLGIGAGMFVDSGGSSKNVKAPYLFLIYMFLLWMPFGLDLYIAGDTYGALIKAACTFGLILIVPFLFAMLWGFVNIGRSIFTPKALFTTGTYHMWPVSMFIGANGPSVLGPVDITGVSEDKCPEPSSGVLGAFLPVIAGLVPGFVPATTAATTAVKVAANSASAAIATTEKGYETLVNSIVNPAAKMVGTGAALATTMATMPQLPMKGGGSSSDGSGTIALLALFTVIIGGGTLNAARRMNLNELLFNKQKSKDANDRPPEP